jgi:hypothetical protein
MSSIENAKLQTQAKMSNTIFLNPVGPSQKTVYVQIRNTSQVLMPELKAMVVPIWICKKLHLILKS